MNREETIEFEKTGKRPDPKKDKFREKISKKINKGIEALNSCQKELIKLYKKGYKYFDQVKKKSDGLSKQELDRIESKLKEVNRKIQLEEKIENNIISHQAIFHIQSEQLITEVDTKIYQEDYDKYKSYIKTAKQLYEESKK